MRTEGELRVEERLRFVSDFCLLGKCGLNVGTCGIREYRQYCCALTPIYPHFGLRLKAWRTTLLCRHGAFPILVLCCHTRRVRPDGNISEAATSLVSCCMQQQQYSGGSLGSKKDAWSWA